MKVIRLLFLPVVLGLVMIVVGYKTQYLPSQLHQPIAALIEKLPKTQVVLDSAQLASQTAQLTERGSQVLEQGTKVLGAAVTVDESQENSSLTDRALNYGRYLYCKQVVEDWETRTSPTPSP